jgi:hypothetical protein
MYSTCHDSLILLDLIRLLALLKTINYESPHFAVFFNVLSNFNPSILGSNVFVHDLFSVTLSLSNVGDHFSRPYKTTVDIMSF